MLGALALAAAACSSPGGRPEALYPSRPPATPGPPVADPAPSRVVLHTTVTRAALEQALEEALPPSGEGSFSMAGQRRFTWKRDRIALRFDRGRVGIDMHVVANLELPVSSMDAALDFRILTEPVVTSEYQAKLQSTEVAVSSPDKLVKLADIGAGVLDTIKKAVETQLAEFSYDLRPAAFAAYQRVGTPIDLPLGDASGCAELKLLGVEAAPTVLADGLERDIAFVIAPSITLPCAAHPEEAELPPLANVAALPTGPFTVGVPIAARYDELAKAMTLAFTDGKLFFSKEYPKIYLEKPEVYASNDQLVLKLHIGGPVATPLGFTDVLDGDIYFAGHPVVRDNELLVPDLEPTIETSSFLLKLKEALDGDAIKRQARDALRLDIGERLKTVRDRLSANLSFGVGQGCLKASADKIEVTGVHPHGNYLRVHVAVTGRAAAYVPCP